MINKYAKEVIQNNKLVFISLLREIKRPDCNIDGLINKLEHSDFFEAPASAKYHNAYIGGLVEHSLNVYHNLKNLIELKGLKQYFDEDSIIICGLLHDMAKMNYYEVTMRNEKVYREDGNKYDELGRFDWVSTPSFRTRKPEDRFIYGNHEETSQFMVSRYIPLTVEESVAILNHHCGMSYDCIKEGAGLSDKLIKYPLTTLLHLADMLATYVDESEGSFIE